MTHAVCATCGVRFAPAQASYLTSCPTCGQTLKPLESLAGAIGYRLFQPDENAQEMSEALESSMPVPDPWTAS